MNLNGKVVKLGQLAAELTAAGVLHRGLGTGGDELHTYTPDGVPVDLPPAARAVLDAHVPPGTPASPTFGGDEIQNTTSQLADAVVTLRDYLALPSPTNAQTIGAFKLLVRVVLFVLKRLNAAGTL